MTTETNLISGDALKAAALKFLSEMRTKVEREQSGLHSIFDSWFTRVLTRLLAFDPSRSWEDSVRDNAARTPAQDGGLQWDLMRLRLFLDRWRQGRFVEYTHREQSGSHYYPRFGTEFGIDVLLDLPRRTGADALARHAAHEECFRFRDLSGADRGAAAANRFEAGSGPGASAVWFADIMAFCGAEGRVHSVDRVKAGMEHPGVSFYQGDRFAPIAYSMTPCCDPSRIPGWSSKTPTIMSPG